MSLNIPQHNYPHIQQVKDIKISTLKMSNQNAVRICNSLYGNKQECKDLRNSRQKCK
jgi:hypothetical protein